MHRGCLLFGLLVVVGMCLVPPTEVQIIRHGDTVNSVVQGRFASAGMQVSSHVVYRPVWAAPPTAYADSTAVEGHGIDATRLFVQLLAAVVLFGGLGMLPRPGCPPPASRS
jgi:hypothetical protein